MTAAFVTWGVVVAGLISGYALVAGIVFRHLGAPRRCNGKAKSLRYTSLPCSGPHAFLSGDHCRECGEVRSAIRRAWLWPLTLILLIPRTAFNAGADLTATPPTNSEDSGAAQERGDPEVIGPEAVGTLRRCRVDRGGFRGQSVGRVPARSPERTHRPTTQHREARCLHKAKRAATRPESMR